ncbi:hypothetical protein [Streptomyces sp. JHA26]|uniref:hypothetical protein n=1 Tax=Streptomyces sp. JHA26 TaxID=1917143 RepID=UPI00209B3A7F|nr:hypothetical protein [Streptomyces sp. JHA26]
MSDEAQPPRADEQAPKAAGNGSAPRPQPPGDGERGGTRAAPAGGTADAVPGVDLGKPDHRAGASGRTTPEGRGADPRPGTGPSGADPWAPPADAAAPDGPGGPGGTLASNAPSPWSAPSVHDQRTVTSLPAMGTQPPPWATPGAPAPADGTANPFAPPAAAAPASGAANPFAAPAQAQVPPYAGQDQAVPPPPIAPDGPGQVPYGYPGGPGPGGYAAPQPPGYYGWPGMTPMPSNGMGTAGLVLGIVAAAVFCLWPLAIVLGILGVVFGALGRGKARRGEATNPGQALAGIICGTAGIVLGVGFGALVIFT